MFIRPTKLVYVTTNKTGYMILYCDRFIILFTQIIHTNKKLKKIFFNLIIQYLEKYSSTSYTTAAFVLASRHPGLEIKTMYYRTLYSTYSKEPLVQDACM